MNRRQFLSLTGTFTGGTLLLPDFLYTFGTHQPHSAGNGCVVFIQLNGGNDGLNTFIPYENPLYYHLRPKIAILKADVVSQNNGMAFHPALRDFATIQQQGYLSVVQNVGYPNPVQSHFRSLEIWQTASDATQYLDTGWLGRYLDLQCNGHQPTAGINLDSIDNLALRGHDPNAITVKDPARFIQARPGETDEALSGNPQLDFVRRIAGAINEGSEEIARALQHAKSGATYPKTALGKNLEWLSRLIKGGLNSKIYYTSHNGFDTHANQLPVHKNKLAELNDAVFSFYNDLKESRLLPEVTVVIFSEFGRRVIDNGSGSDHGTAAPMFIIGGNNKGKVIGKNPDLSNLSGGDLRHEIDFRSVYAALLQHKLDFDYTKINIKNQPIADLF